MTTSRIATGTVASLAGVAAAAALVAAAAVLAPAPAHAACANYVFKGGLLQIEMDNGVVVQIPASGTTVGPGQAMESIPGKARLSTGKAHGSIVEGRKLYFTVNFDQGPLTDTEWNFSGEVNDDGRASGNMNYGVGWHTNDTLSCFTAPAPMPKLSPPPQPPTDAVSVSWGDYVFGVGLPVQVINTSSTLGRCTYDATAPNSLLPPYHRDFVVSPVSVPAKWNIPGVPTGTQWHVVVSCRGDFNGQNVEIGHVDTTKTF